MSLETLEALVADRLDAMVLKEAAFASGREVTTADRRWHELVKMETNGLCLALRAMYAEEGIADPDHFPNPAFISEEWRNKHRSIF